MIHYITYATHDQGLFKELVENPYIKINVMGFGAKWNGFNDKFKGVLEYTRHIPDDDYVVFLDGFDTTVVKEPKDIIERFKSYNCDILFSDDSLPVPNYVKEKIFGTCNDEFLNSGMYMGKAKSIRELSSLIVKQKYSTDDQKISTTICNLDIFNIKVDVKHKIFLNYGAKSNDYYFMSYPGGTNSLPALLERFKRSVKDYGSYLYLEAIIIILLFIMAYIFYNYNLKKKK